MAGEGEIMIIPITKDDTWKGKGPVLGGGSVMGEGGEKVCFPAQGLFPGWDD